MCRSQMPRRWGSLVAISASLTFTAPPLTAQSTPPADPLTSLGDSSHVAAVACDIASATRPPRARTDCHVVAFRETAAEFIVRVRGTPVGLTRSIDFPLSEVRLHKDQTRAVLIRVPEL